MPSLSLQHVDKKVFYEFLRSQNFSREEEESGAAATRVVTKFYISLKQNTK